MTLDGRIQNLIHIRLSGNESIMWIDDGIQEMYPLIPGRFFHGEHYGIILKIDTKLGQGEFIYRTQNKINSIGIEGNRWNDLKIFEYRKYHPWLFTYDGKFKSNASYHYYSKRDKDNVYGCYDFNCDCFNEYFTLSRRR